MATKKPSSKKEVTKVTEVKKPEAKKAAEVKKPEAKKSPEKKAAKIDQNLSVKSYFKTDATTCTMFAILDGKVVLELHGNVEAWKAIENKFGCLSDLIVTDVKEVEEFPDIAVNFETSVIYRAHNAE